MNAVMHHQLARTRHGDLLEQGCRARLRRDVRACAAKAGRRSRAAGRRTA